MLYALPYGALIITRVIPYCQRRRDPPPVSDSHDPSRPRRTSAAPIRAQREKESLLRRRRNEQWSSLALASELVSVSSLKIRLDLVRGSVLSFPPRCKPPTSIPEVPLHQFDFTLQPFKSQSRLSLNSLKLPTPNNIPHSSRTLSCELCHAADSPLTPFHCRYLGYRIQSIDTLTATIAIPTALDITLPATARLILNGRVLHKRTPRRPQQPLLLAWSRLYVWVQTRLTSI